MLNYLKKHGLQSRIDLSKKLNLTKAIITKLTNELIEKGILIEKGEQISLTGSHSRGRRKTLLDINENYKLVFGIVIEKNELVVGLTNLKGHILDKKKTTMTEITYRELLELIVLNMQLIMKDNCISNEHVLGVGVCMSVGAGWFIDGSKTVDKLTRLKKDLVHAMPIKMITSITMSGSLVAQQLFENEQAKSILLLRLGEVSQSGIMIGGAVYEGFAGTAGGFDEVGSGEVAELDGMMAYNQLVADSIIASHKVLDTQKIYCFGGQFESQIFLQSIQDMLGQKGYKKLGLERPLVTDDTIFLAPCAQAIEKFFYLN